MLTIGSFLVLLKLNIFTSFDAEVQLIKNSQPATTCRN